MASSAMFTNKCAKRRPYRSFAFKINFRAYELTYSTQYVYFSAVFHKKMKLSAPTLQCEAINTVNDKQNRLRNDSPREMKGEKDIDRESKSGTVSVFTSYTGLKSQTINTYIHTGVYVNVHPLNNIDL